MLEARNLGDELFRLFNEYLAENDLRVNTGTIAGASIIDAPSSSKRKDGKRDPAMHQTKKGAYRPPLPDSPLVALAIHVPTNVAIKMAI